MLVASSCCEAFGQPPLCGRLGPPLAEPTITSEGLRISWAGEPSCRTLPKGRMRTGHAAPTTGNEVVGTYPTRNFAARRLKGVDSKSAPPLWSETLEEPRQPEQPKRGDPKQLLRELQPQSDRLRRRWVRPGRERLGHRCTDKRYSRNTRGTVRSPPVVLARLRGVSLFAMASGVKS